jgi:hypothetical protein
MTPELIFAAILAGLSFLVVLGSIGLLGREMRRNAEAHERVLVQIADRIQFNGMGTFQGLTRENGSPPRPEFDPLFAGQEYRSRLRNMGLNPDDPEDVAKHNEMVENAMAAQGMPV